MRYASLLAALALFASGYLAACGTTASKQEQTGSTTTGTVAPTHGSTTVVHGGTTLRCTTTTGGVLLGCSP